jgi:hypothetical protein
MKAKVIKTINIVMIWKKVGETSKLMLTSYSLEEEYYGLSTTSAKRSKKDLA